MIITLHHVTLPMPVGKESEAEAFYSGVLGLPRSPKPKPMGTTGAWFILPDGRQIHLQAAPEFQPLSDPHPALVVEDFEEAKRVLTENGYQWLPDDLWPGHKRAFSFDPFGNRLEFIGKDPSPFEYHLTAGQ